MAAKNPTEQTLAMIGDKYIPHSYDQYVFLTNSEGNSVDMHGVDVTSGTPERFSMTVASGHLFKANRLNVELVDGAMTPAKFGGLTALTTGLQILHYAADGTTVLKDFMNGQFIKKNADWSALVGTDGTQNIAAGVGSNPVRWSMFKSGEPYFMKAGESLAFEIHDSLDGITDFRAMVQGIQYPDQ